jgi:hypothetical protein
MPRLALLAFLIATGCTFRPASNPARAQEPARTSVDGEIMGVDRVPPSERLDSGMRVTLRTDASEPVVVDLAPEWYLTQNGLAFGKNDRMKVEGSRAGSVFYATRVEKAGKRVELRDPTGRPLWGKPPR